MEENKKSSLLKSTMNYGVMLGLALVIYSLLLWMFDATFSQGLSYLSYVIIIGGIILATRAYRDQEQGGYISYGRALGVGTLTVLFASVITSLYTYLLFTVIDTGLVDRLMIIREEALYESGLSDDQIDMAMEMTKRFANPVFMAISGFIGTVFMGFIFSLITSIFLKKEGDHPELH
jgi:hypothetical protein